MRLRRPDRFVPRVPGQWERNLYVLWVAQAASAMGFSFFFPFVPLFIQDLGIEDPGSAALWSGIAGGAGGIFMMVSGPIWGILGDRYGLKKNILRAMFGSALILGLTGLVTDVYQLVAFRIVLGLVSGTWVTIMALVSASAPKDKVSYGIGVVQSASFVGFTVGPLVGGLLADSIGFRQTFMVTGALCTFAGLMVLFFVKENFERPRQVEKLGAHVLLRNVAKSARIPGLASVLVVLLLIQVGPTIMMPVLPVFIGTLSAAGSAASSAGIAFSIMGGMGAVSSVVTSKLSSRFGIGPVMTVAFVGGGLLYLPLIFVDSLAPVFVIVGFMGFFNGGLNTLAFALVGLTVPQDKQGAAYGVAQSATSLAWGGGPLLGGAIAGLWGLREVFLVNAIGLLVTAVLAARLFGGSRSEAAHESVEVGPAVTVDPAPASAAKVGG